MTYPQLTLIIPIIAAQNHEAIKQFNNEAMTLLSSKIAGVFLRAWHAILFFPKRAWRLGRHLFLGLAGLYQPVLLPLPVNRYGRWWMELTFYLLDVLAVPELYETMMDFGKWKTRPLTGAEIKTARSVFW